MEEIIPFLIFVFWIIMNLLGQKRKAEKRRQREIEKQQNRDLQKPQQPAQPRPSRKPVPPIIYESEDVDIDILDEILGKKRHKPKPDSKFPLDSASSSKSMPVSKFEDSASIALKEKQITEKMKRDYERQLADFKLSIDKAFKRKNVHGKKSTKGRYSKAYFSDFNLKKAVIYSEILRRPYM